jgi:uncharacterized membrane protein YkvI
MGYISKRMPEETIEISHWIGAVALCGFIACLLVARMKKRNSELTQILIVVCVFFFSTLNYPPLTECLIGRFEEHFPYMVD